MDDDFLATMGGGGRGGNSECLGQTIPLFLLFSDWGGRLLGNPIIGIDVRIRAAPTMKTPNHQAPIHWGSSIVIPGFPETNLAQCK